MFGHLSNRHACMAGHVWVGHEWAGHAWTLKLSFSYEWVGHKWAGVGEANVGGECTPCK